MTNDEAADILLGLPRRARIERAVEKLREQLLAADEANLPILWNIEQSIAMFEIHTITIGWGAPR